MPMTEFAAADGAAIADPTEMQALPLDTRSFADLDLELIVERRYQPRTIFDEGALQELADDIARRGLLQPILVRPLPPNRLQDTFESRPAGQRLPEFEIVAGARRFRASRLAGMKSIPALIRALDDVQAAEACLVENLRREDLTELEEAEGYAELVETTGVAKEDIGARINKSRSYVYGRMKLLDLTATPREALRKGEIDASRALLIARIPSEKLQLEALEEATAKDHQGSPRLSYRAFQTWVQQNVMLKLATAIFPIDDATLVSPAGPCTTCMKRTGAAPDVFTDVDGPDVCTDPTCFHEKVFAHTDRIADAARARGVEVIEGKEALELKPHQYASWLRGYNDLTSELRAELSTRDLGMVKLFIDPHTHEPREIIPADLAQKARHKASVKELKRDPELAKKHAQQQAKDEEREAKEVKRQLTRDYQARWREAAADQLKAGILAGNIQALSANLLRQVLIEMAFGSGRCERSVSNVLEVDQYDEELLASTIRSLDDTQVGYTLLLVLLDGDRSPVWDYVDGDHVFSDAAPSIEELARLLSFDVQAVKEDVQQQIRAERAEVEASGAELAAQPEGSAKGKKSKARPAAPAKKPSKEEVQASIATALQELDAGPAGEPADEAGDAVDSPAADAAAESPAEIGISDSVEVNDTKYSQHGKRGTVTRLESKNKVRVAFDDEGTVVVLPVSALTLVSKALWPWPGSDATPTPARPELSAGQRVKVRGSLSGHNAEYHGKEGTLKRQVDGTTKWVVNLAKPKKAPKLVELEADALEVLA